MRHTRYGYWLEEAGPVEPTRPLEGDTTADVVIVGAGYLGLWTAWQLKALEPGLDVVVLEAGLAGHGPSGRNGGFVSTLWDDLPILRDRVGDTRAVEVCRASERAVQGIGAFCAEQGVDARYRAAGTLQVATSEAQVGDWDELVDGVRGRRRALGGAAADAGRGREAMRVAGLPGGLLLPTAANVQPALLALGLRAKVIDGGRPAPRADAGAKAVGGRERVDARGETVRAGAAVLAVNSATAGFHGFRHALSVASSHMVISEPVPDVIEEIGWTGGENIHDCRTLLHYLRTTKDGRIALGWAGGQMGFGGRHRDRLDIDPSAARHAAAALRWLFPQLAGREVTHAWGGPIDVSPTHLPIFGSRGRVHHGFGFTGNGVGPTYLGGEILARLALDRRDEITRLAIVEPDRKLFPPEPLRFIGGTTIRAALVRRDDAHDRGDQPDPLTGFVSSLPRRLGLRLPR